jgi:hypothetical protein
MEDKCTAMTASKPDFFNGSRLLVIFKILFKFDSDFLQTLVLKFIVC